MFDPVEQAEAEDQAKAAWGVRLDDYQGQVWAGTSRMEIIGDTPTLHHFMDLLSTGAHDQLDPSRPADEQPSPGPPPGRGAQLPDQRDHHRSADQGLRALRPRRPQDKLALGTVEKLGPLTVTTIKEWLGTSRFTLQPVLDGPHRLRRPARPARVDARAGDPPRPRVRLPLLPQERPRLRPRPHRGLRRDGRRRTTGPDPARQPRAAVPATSPGQDPPRLDLRPQPDGTYTWTSPYGRRFTVDTDGTVTRS